MKLIFCVACHDVLSLALDIKKCGCGESEGKYLDSKDAEIAGPCIPIGFDNRSFTEGLNYKDNFVAFVIDLDNCRTIKRRSK